MFTGKTKLRQELNRGREWNCGLPGFAFWKCGFESFLGDVNILLYVSYHFYYAHNLTVCNSQSHMSPWTGVLLKQLRSSKEMFSCIIQVCVFSLNRVCDIQFVRKQTLCLTEQLCSAFCLSTGANKGWQEGHF